VVVVCNSILHLLQEALVVVVEVEQEVAEVLVELEIHLLQLLHKGQMEVHQLQVHLQEV
tara:strand:- start:339 stop:515 length:177 start_codon:yes stop_codon:yes gene_type:complete